MPKKTKKLQDKQRIKAKALLILSKNFSKKESDKVEREYRRPKSKIEKALEKTHIPPGAILSTQLIKKLQAEFGISRANISTILNESVNSGILGRKYWNGRDFGKKSNNHGGIIYLEQPESIFVNSFNLLFECELKKSPEDSKSSLVLEFLRIDYFKEKMKQIYEQRVDTFLENQCLSRNKSCKKLLIDPYETCIISPALFEWIITEKVPISLRQAFGIIPYPEMTLHLLKVIADGKEELKMIKQTRRSKDKENP